MQCCQIHMLRLHPTGRMRCMKELKESNHGFGFAWFECGKVNDQFWNVLMQ